MHQLNDQIFEGLNDDLKTVFHEFDNYCKKHGCFYDITSDEANEQGYVIKDKKFFDDLNEFIQPLAQSLNVHLEVDKERRDGILFRFTPMAIADGHWKANPKTRSDYSIFANEKDAKKVRSGQTMYQKKLSERIDRLLEDQYKSPVSRHTRKQSAFPSSVGPSKSFGGIRTDKLGKPVSEMIIPQVEQPSSLGTVSAQRTNDFAAGERKDIQVQRRDLTDLPTAVRPNDLQHDSTTQNKIPGTNVGRTSDDSKRSIVTKKVVPDAGHGTSSSEELADWLVDTFGSTPEEVRDNGVMDSVGTMEMQARIDQRIITDWLTGREMPLHQTTARPVAKRRDTQFEREPSIEVVTVIDATEEMPQDEEACEVVPADTASKEAEDPLNAMAASQNMRPIGVFGPTDKRKGCGGPVSNVRVQHPRLHDTGMGNITVQKM